MTGPCTVWMSPSGYYVPGLAPLGWRNSAIWWHEAECRANDHAPSTMFVIAHTSERYPTGVDT